MSKNIVIKIEDGETEVAYQPDDVNLIIINMDNNDLYLYNDNLICQVSSINDDGTVNLVCVDSLDGCRNNRHLMNIPADSISFYGSDDNFIGDDYDWVD